MADWLRIMWPLIRRFNSQSSGLASAYLRNFKEAETGSRDVPIIPGGVPDEAAAMVSLQVTGPITIKRAVGEGLSPEEAVNRATRRVAGAVQRMVARGGRETIHRSVSADSSALGWRRVPGPHPCAFCAMLASRGPIYGSREIAAGNAYHDHCGCTAEPSYGNYKADAQIRRYEELYKRASRAGDTRAILREMQRLMDSE